MKETIIRAAIGIVCFLLGAAVVMALKNTAPTELSLSQKNQVTNVAPVTPQAEFKRATDSKQPPIAAPIDSEAAPAKQNIELATGDVDLQNKTKEQLVAAVVAIERRARSTFKAAG